MASQVQAQSTIDQAQQLNNIPELPLLPLWRSSPDRKCDDPRCPLNQKAHNVPHLEGIYKHDGPPPKKNLMNFELFGASKPPPFIWKASMNYYRWSKKGESCSEAMQNKAKKCKEMVENFLWLHGEWPGGMPVDDGFRW